MNGTINERFGNVQFFFDEKLQKKSRLKDVSVFITQTYFLKNVAWKMFHFLLHKH